ncbi:hypothetical protein K443DRAFT_671719 [Laccaria amethystina LaAM-08-1]|uniref:Trafficking protein particle complex subunit 11 n=1 Tax=Laccaria amethystina LaAM-08-1 TaxID=1095629 RepID=A0A0C9YMM8_9AGAR|nr:hypothetical protein K443DRAFT_671719 [Laccaria amethystina LaAM-08-1]
MNSYPPELLAQLAPIMFVAGLDSPATKSQDAFQVLTLRLRDALLAQRKVAIWQPEKTKSFQVVLVDRDVRFPPRKLLPLDDPQYAAAHSPLSPLTPSSPLHPDGLIAPIWIRKHTTLLPSVFVLFLRIFEFPPQASKTLPDLPDVDRDREREQEERKRDTELSAEVALRKKSMSERGIKLTVVLMASRRMLDDPTLDARLTFIRRQSGLDSRAALFVLSPVSAAELNDFVRSLQQALYESAVEYYTAHSKRVRRKRNRHSQAHSSYPGPAAVSGLNIPRPLRPEGWTVRYEYKMACFAEFRSEDEVALKHYQDAYDMLIIMFGSTAILPPRTKRWAEAKVLADCINIKIVKLYLYNNEHALALSHHNTHIRQFGDFSRGWGIGEETFEFWSWVARQHRILAELLDQGVRSALILPVHKPALTSQNLHALNQSTRIPGELDFARSAGINPSHALQHPGFYYYMAARCTEMRRERFQAAIEAELSSQPGNLSPGFANEKKVEHLAIILELYTKAYELFKKYTPASSQTQAQGRLTLWIAYRIAQTYHQSGKFDMAVRFFERIARTYRREKWYSMLPPLLSTWYTCAQQLGDVELSICLLIEMLGHDSVESEDPGSLEEDLLAVLKSAVPATPEDTLVVDLSEAQPIFNSSVILWTPDINVGESSAFQISLTAPTCRSIKSIPFSSLAVYVKDRVSPLIIRHSPSDTDPPLLGVVNLGHITPSNDDDLGGSRTADLRWHPGSTIVFRGTMSSDVPSVLKVTKLALTIEVNTWKVEIPLPPCSSRVQAGHAPRWLSSLDPPKFIPIERENYDFTAITHVPHQLDVSLVHHAPAFLDESYPIVVQVTNTDSRTFDIVVDILLQPTEIDDAVNYIVVDDQQSSGLIKGIQFGVLGPGASGKKTIHLFNSGAGGERMIDVSIQSRPNDSEDETNEDDDNENDLLSDDKTETLRTLVIPTVNPFKVTSDVSYRHKQEPWPGLANLQTFDAKFWDDRRGGEAIASMKFECTGPWNLLLDSVTLEREDNIQAKIIECSTDQDDADMFPAEYLPGDEFRAIYRISLATDEEISEDLILGPGRFVVKWRRNGQDAELDDRLCTTFISLPSLRHPSDGLVALLNVPPVATLHDPITLSLIIRNYHPSRSANIAVQLEPDTLDGFIVAGLRSGHIPVLLPGAEEKLLWRLIPVECGHVRIPRLKIFNKRAAIVAAQGSDQSGSNADIPSGEVVRVVNVGHDRGCSVDVGPAGGEDHTILVLP